MSRYLDPTNDVAFKKLFGAKEHEPLLISFLNAILDLKEKRSIKQIELLPQEQAPQVMGGRQAYSTLSVQIRGECNMLLKCKIKKSLPSSSAASIMLRIHMFHNHLKVLVI